MGLGKTVQAIAAALIYRSDWPVLVICPSSVRLHWEEQLLHWLGVGGSAACVIRPEDVLVVAAASAPALQPMSTQLKKVKFLIVSYSMMTNAKLIAAVNALSPGLVICDESHYLKNSRARRTKSILPYIKCARRAFLLSGTPALSRPYELFTQLNALNSDVWPDDKAFFDRYCKQNNRGYKHPYNRLSHSYRYT